MVTLLNYILEEFSSGYKIGTDGTMWILNIEPSYRHKSETMLALNSKLAKVFE